MRAGFVADTFPVVIAAVIALRYFATVAAAAVLAVGFDGAEKKMKLSGDGKSQSLLFRASRLAGPAVSSATSLGLGAASVAYVTSKAAAVGIFTGADAFTCTATSKLVEGLLAVDTPAKSNETATILVAVTAALALLRLMVAFTSSAVSTPGVTSSSHDVRVSRDAFVAVACFAAMYTDTFLCALAAGSVAHLHSGAASFREFARVGAGFPHGDSAAHRASYPAEMLAYVVSRAAPHALALAAAAPRAMAAATSAAPAVTSAVLTGVKAVMDAAAGSAGGAGAAGAGSGAAAAAGSAAEAVASAAAPAVPAVCACVIAAGSSLHSHSH